jgi:hypothetical protein
MCETWTQRVAGVPGVCAVTVLLLGGIGAAVAQAQTAEAAPQAQSQAMQGERRLRVYLDCFQCFADYLRDQVRWVDFVRQPQDADVVLLSSTRQTGGGGTEYLLRFVGEGRFDGINKELRAVSLTGDPEDVRRGGVLDAVMVGLLSYMAVDGLPQGFDLSVRPRTTTAEDVVPVRDPWNLWVFSVRGNVSFEAEEQTREFRWSGRASADRITDRWKLSFGASIDQTKERFELDDEDPFEVTRGNREVETFVARSLGPHWSFGFDAGVNSSDFGNTELSARLSPAVEFSVFPYQEYATRQLLVTYELGARHARYKEITVFDKLRETLWGHELSLSFDQRQPWGSVELGAEWSQYFHDFSLYRLEVQGEVDFRITRGLSLSIDANASRIRDQISLPRRGATPEEVLLRLRQLQSGYEVGASVGLTYTFGSLFNNVVNPRFGGR